jgi:hypothetical protein
MAMLFCRFFSAIPRVLGGSALSDATALTQRRNGRSGTLSSRVLILFPAEKIAGLGMKPHLSCSVSMENGIRRSIYERRSFCSPLYYCRTSGPSRAQILRPAKNNSSLILEKMTAGLGMTKLKKTQYQNRPTSFATAVSRKFSP